MDSDANSLANSLTRLLRSAPDDPSRRTEFVVRYDPKVSRWARARGLSEADAQELAETISARLAARMPDFDAESTRGHSDWLWDLTEQALTDFTARARRRAVTGETANSLGDIDHVERKQELRADLAAEFQLELIAEAKSRVRARVSPRQWQAFRLLVIENRSGVEISALVSMSVPSVYNAKSKVLRLLQDEILLLEGPENHHPRESLCASITAGQVAD